MGLGALELPPSPPLHHFLFSEEWYSWPKVSVTALNFWKARSHKSLYSALWRVISPVLCHLSMQSFRILRKPESSCRSRSSASTTPAEVWSGALTISTSCPGAVQMKQKENSQHPNSAVSVRTILRFLKQDGKLQHRRPWLLCFAGLHGGKKSRNNI